MHVLRKGTGRDTYKAQENHKAAKLRNTAPDIFVRGFFEEFSLKYFYFQEEMI